MNLLEKINTDYITAFKSGDNTKKNLLRMVKSAMGNFKIEKKRELTDMEIISVLRKEQKKREDSIFLYVQGGREDLANNEREENNIINNYLPTEIPEEKLIEAIHNTIKNLAESSGVVITKKNMGQIIKIVADNFQGAVDNRRISQHVNTLLN